MSFVDLKLWKRVVALDLNFKSEVDFDEAFDIIRDAKSSEAARTTIYCNFIYPRGLSNKTFFEINNIWKELHARNKN